MTKPKEKPTVRVRPFRYQPSKVELEEIRDALMRSVRVEETANA